MEKVQKILMQLFCASIIVCIVFLILCETDVIPTGILTESKNSEFVLLTVMEILTLGFIPLALRLFKFNRIHNQLVEHKERALLPWGIVRLNLLIIPMILNALFYYLYMNVAFGYLGIILFLCLFFIIPTINRCNSDVEG